MKALTKLSVKGCAVASPTVSSPRLLCHHSPGGCGEQSPQPGSARSAGRQPGGRQEGLGPRGTAASEWKDPGFGAHASYQKKKKKRKKKELQINTTGCPDKRLLKRDALVLNFLLLNLIPPAPLQASRKPPALTRVWQSVSRMEGRCASWRGDPCPLHAEPPPANTNIRRLFTMVARVAKPQQVCCHLSVSMFFQG